MSLGSSVIDAVSYYTLWVRQMMESKILVELFWWCTAVLSVFSCWSIALALCGSALQRRQLRRLERAKAAEPRYPKIVSVLMAAWNEEKVIERTVRALFAGNNPFALQIVVVSDGSTDGTDAILARLAEEFSEYPRKLVAARIEHKGKGDALNYALERGLVKGEAFVSIDADTVVDERTVKNLVRHFCDPTVGAVAGRIKVLNRGRGPWQWLLTTWQQAEYNLGIGLTRAAQASLGAIMIVPGACSAWRTNTVVGLGGFPLDTKAEDADLGMLIRWRRLRVIQDVEAVAYTEVPTTWRGLKKQQLRWTFGIYQVLYKHSRMMTHPVRFGALAWLVMPFAFLCTVIPTLVMPVAYIISGFAIASGNGHIVLGYALLFTAARVVMSLGAMITLREWSWDPFTALFYRLLNDPLQLYLAWRSLYAVISGRGVGWNKVARVGDGTVLANDTRGEPAFVTAE